MSSNRSKYQRIRGRVSACTRFGISLGVGASLASGVHFFGKWVATKAGNFSKAVTNGNYVVTGLSFVVSTIWAKKSFDDSNQISTGLEHKILEQSKLQERSVFRVESINSSLSAETARVTTLLRAKELRTGNESSVEIKQTLQKLARNNPIKEIKEIKETSTRFAELQSRFVTPIKWLVSSGFSANMTSGFHYCAEQVIKSAISNEKILNSLLTTNYVIAGITFLGVYRLANNKLNRDIRRVQDSGHTVTTIERKNEKLKLVLETMKVKAKMYNDLITILNSESINRDDLIAEFVRIQHDELLESKDDDFILNGYSEKPGRCRTIWNKTKSCMKLPATLFLSVLSGISFASSQLYCGELPITSGEENGLGDSWVTALKVFNYTLTAAVFIATTKYAAAEMQVNVHQVDNLGSAVRKETKENKELQTAISILEKVIATYESKLNSIIEEELERKHNTELEIALTTSNLLEPSITRSRPREKQKRDNQKVYKLVLSSPARNPYDFDSVSPLDAFPLDMDHHEEPGESKQIVAPVEMQPIVLSTPSIPARSLSFFKDKKSQLKTALLSAEKKETKRI